MKLTCSQMEVLISFYLEGDLSPSLKKQVEEHLEECSLCKTKYNVIEALLGDMQKSVSTLGEYSSQQNFTNSEQYQLFKTNMSAYIDNELPENEKLKIKKFTISNKCARNELEKSYRIRKLINDSYLKTKNDTKADFTRSTLKQLQLDEENSLNFHPAIKLLIVFTISVLVLSTIVLVSLSV